MYNSSKTESKHVIEPLPNCIIKSNLLVLKCFLQDNGMSCNSSFRIENKMTQMAIKRKFKV